MPVLEENYLINSASTLKKKEEDEEEEMKPKVSRKKQIIKIRGEINKI